MSASLRIGLFAIGLEAYWEQFPGLKQRLEGYLGTVAERLRHLHPHLVNAGLIDTTDKAFEAGSLFRRQEVDLLFLYVSTYALSSTVLPVVQRAGAPVIILNLSPAEALDYRSFNRLADRREMTGEWLAYCSACPVPEIANVFRRTGIRFREVTGLLDPGDAAWREIAEWVEAARVASVMAHNRLGCLGHYYSGMLDIYTDLTGQYAAFGGHIELLEVDELTAIRRAVTPAETAERVEAFYGAFEVQAGCDPEELSRAARTSVALDRLVAKYKLGSMAYYYKGSGVPENEDTMSSVILGNSLLTARGVPVAGEYEIKNAQAMKIMDSFGAGGSFTEYYAVDYRDDVVLMGHDGPGHIAIAEGKTKVRPLEVYHGKVGKGLSVEMSVRHGPVTLLSVAESPGGGLFLLTAEGESVPGPILEIGNTNSRYRFSLGAREFIGQWNARGSAHHSAIGVGHIAGKLRKLGTLLGLEVVTVC